MSSIQDKAPYFLFRIHSQSSELMRSEKSRLTTGCRCARMLRGGEWRRSGKHTGTYGQAFITAMKDTSWSSWPSISWL